MSRRFACVETVEWRSGILRPHIKTEQTTSMYKPGKAPKQIQRQQTTLVAPVAPLAIVARKDAIMHPPESWQFAQNAGNLALEREEWEKAIRWFTKVRCRLWTNL
jgi:hypothetical protein